MAEVVKGKWYPCPPPALPGEPDEAYAARLASGEHGPYGHFRRRECALAYHRTCADRTRPPVNYTGLCKCPCHTDSAPLVSEEPIREVVRLLSELYDLPNRTGSHVVHFVDLLTGAPDATVERVRAALGREYDSEISDGFADDVVQMLANKGPKGGARAFWKRVHTEHRQGKKLLSMVTPESERTPVEQAPPVSLQEAVRRAVEMIEPLSSPVPQPERVTSLGWEKLGLGPHPWDHPNYAEWLGRKLSRELDRAMPSLLGVPVETDPSMLPGTWKMRMNDGTERTGTWPRIVVPGVESLADAIRRIGQDGPAPDLSGSSAPSWDFRTWITEQKWFTEGISVITQLQQQCTPSLLRRLSWRIPANLFPGVNWMESASIYAVPVRVEPGLPPGATPYLAFDLEETS